ncbi:MAG: hypothetical protein JWO32_375 [Bacteroidetes bacterium]|nr:hypothetical protein [Bacteroidota bacterium]
MMFDLHLLYELKLKLVLNLPNERLYKLQADFFN